MNKTRKDEAVQASDASHALRQGQTVLRLAVVRESQAASMSPYPARATASLQFRGEAPGEVLSSKLQDSEGKENIVKTSAKRLQNQTGSRLLSMT